LAIVIFHSHSDCRLVELYRHSCDNSFHERILQLPLHYDEKMYKDVVKDFGTHVIVAAKVGGYITSFTSVEACAAKADHPSPRDSFAAFRAATEFFTVNSSDASMKFLGSEITRESQWVCGGDNEGYKRTFTKPFAQWKDTLFNADKHLCLVSVDLIPIWATIRPIDQVKQGHLAAAVLDYLRTTAQQSDVNMASTAKVTACNVLPGLQG
jgi:MAC/Perforin domain